MHVFATHLTPRALVLLLPGGGQDHTSPGIIARAVRLNETGFEVPVVRSLDEVPALLAAYGGRVGLWGVYAGAHRGLTLLGAEPRITAAVLTFAEAPPAMPLVTATVLTRVQPVRAYVDPEGDALEVGEQLDWLAAHLAG